MNEANLVTKHTPLKSVKSPFLNLRMFVDLCSQNPKTQRSPRSRRGLRRGFQIQCLVTSTGSLAKCKVEGSAGPNPTTSISSSQALPRLCS